MADEALRRDMTNISKSPFVDEIEQYSSYRSIKKKSDHLFNIKKNPKKSLRDYVKRFKAEKAKIIGYDDSIANAVFQKGLPANHPLFREMIMKEDLTLADAFALAEKHALWDEALRAEKAPEQPQKESTAAQKKEDRKSPSKGPSHTTDVCYTWKNYLEKLVKEGKVDRYLDKPDAQPKRNANKEEEPPTKMIRINGIFAESEHLGATNNSKKRNLQQALLISQVQAVNTQPRPIIGFTKQDKEGVDFPHDDALVVSIQLAHAIVDRMMVDNGSAVNLLQLLVIQKMDLESTIIRQAEVLTGFNRHTLTAIGHNTLDMKT
ncbi:uncharacterized protein [Pyrus communis]|uniref:uncharacterized protein n=1 Tax=Pyrus communis TaxID=23211 RepID=UPI0035C0F5BD